MVKEYLLDAEDEEILNELDNLCGVVQNKEILRNMIIYSKLKENEEIKIGNFNIIIRNNSSYSIIDNLLKVCAKILTKHNVIQNDKICYLDKIIKHRTMNPLEQIIGIDASIIVINDSKLRINFEDEIETLKKFMDVCKDKVFVFEDTYWKEGETEAKLGELISWKLTIEKISLEDKIVYCKNILNKNEMKYKYQDLKEFANQPMWQIQKDIIQLVIECKSKGIKSVPAEMFRKNKGKSKNNTSKRNNSNAVKDKKTAKDDLEELIGLENIKIQVQKILNYVKLNKNRGQMPTLHMCFNGNPGTGKTSIARVIGKLFAEENIITGNGEFVEIHGRDLVDKFVGWTASNVKEIVSSAIGGVLFIDEAYSLASDRRGGFEDEAIATLIKEMEDHRSEICIILAGYTDEMKKLIELNPGFESRIQFTINFSDYNEEELYKIFIELCHKENYKISKGCKEELIENFRITKNEKDFGNGRYVRNLFEKIKFEQADRIIRTNSKSINTITASDIKNSIKLIQTNKKEKVRRIGFRE